MENLLASTQCRALKNRPDLIGTIDTTDENFFQGRVLHRERRILQLPNTLIRFSDIRTLYRTSLAKTIRDLLSFCVPQEGKFVQNLLLRLKICTSKFARKILVVSKSLAGPSSRQRPQRQPYGSRGAAGSGSALRACAASE